MNGNEWNGMKLSNLDWKQYRKNGMESFYDNNTIRPLF